MENVLQAQSDRVIEELGELLATPALSGPQAQGDLLILPWADGLATARRDAMVSRGSRIPAEGVVLVRGEGGNTHTLLDPDAAGVTWTPEAVGAQTLGTLAVPSGAVAYIDHAEHGRNAVAAGVYVVRRQVEWADARRLVED